MRQCRLSRLYCACHALPVIAAFAACTAATLRVASADSFQHPISTEARLPFTQEATRRPDLFTSTDLTPPLAETARLADGSIYFSRDINRILCAAERGTGTAAETWLGTRYGVKCVDRKSGTVRHFTRADGLPGDTVLAITAASDGVWCIVEVSGISPGGTLKTALCSLDAKTGRWTNLGEFSSYPSYGGDGSDSFQREENGQPASRILAASGRAPGGFAVFIVNAPVGSGSSPRETGEPTDRFAVVWDSKTRTLIDIPWDPFLRADYDRLSVRALAADAAGFWVGTNAGLLRCDFGTGEVGKTTPVWKRFLPAYRVDEIALDSDSRAYAILRRRSRPGERFLPGGPNREWTLARVGRDGSATLWTPPGISEPSSQATVASTVNSARDAVDTNRPGIFPAPSLQKLSENPPVGLTVLVNGNVWISHRGAVAGNDPRRSFSMFHSPGENLGGFTVFHSKTESWNVYPIRPAASPSPRMSPLQTRLEISAPDRLTSSQPGVLPFQDVPDSAVLPLALSVWEPTGRPETDNHAGDSDALFWIRRRFPEWLCPDQSEIIADAVDAGRQADSGTRSPYVSSSTRRSRKRTPVLSIPLPDPADPKSVWIVDQSDQTLTRLPLADIPVESSAKSQRDSHGHSMTPPPPFKPLAGPNVERFPLPDGMMVRASPGVAALLSLPGEPRKIWVVTPHEVRVWDDSVSAWQPVTLPQGRFPLELQTYGDSSPVLPDDSGKSALMIEPGTRRLVSFDTATGAATPLPPAAQPPVGARMIARDQTGGVWFRWPQPSGEVALTPDRYLPFAARSSARDDAPAGSAFLSLPPLPPPPDLPVDSKMRLNSKGNPRRGTFLGATGATGWFLLPETAHSDSGMNSLQYVAGYDTRKGTWTAVLSLPYVWNANRPNVLPDGDNGSAYLSGSEKTSAVYRYDAAADRWAMAAPVLPAELVQVEQSPVDGGPAPRLIAADDRRFLVLLQGRLLYRCERVSGRWGTPVALPGGLTLSAQESYYDGVSIGCVGDTVFAGNRAGLYRMSFEAATPASTAASKTAPNWTFLDYDETVRLTFRSAEVGPESRPLPGYLPAMYRWHQVVATARFVYGIIGNEERSLFVRLDRKTARWTVFNDARGFATFGQDLSQIIPDNYGVWLIHRTGTYRVDEEGDRLRLILRDHSYNWDETFTLPAAALPDGGASVPTGSFVALVPDPAAPEKSDLMLVNEIPNDRMKPRTPSLWRADLTSGHVTFVSHPAPNANGYNIGGSATSLVLAHDRLWVGAQNCLFVLPASGDSAWTVARPPEISPSTSISALSGDPKTGALWIESTDSALYWAKPAPP